MNCKNCGQPLTEDGNFCQNCGAPIGFEESEPVTPIEPEAAYQASTEQIGEGILKGKDGVLRWTYEVNMYKNPVIIFTAWKVFMAAALAPGLLMFFLELGKGFVPALVIFLKIFGLVAGICTLLMFIAYYLILAPINGGRYCVIFEMDNNGIKHTQMKKQFKKSQVLSLIGVLAGALAGNPSVAGANMMAGAKQSTYSRFGTVRKIIVLPKQHTIKINTKDMVHNQIYANNQDFPFILDHIIQHSPKNIMIKN